MIRKLFTFFVTFILWILLSWPFLKEGIDWQALLAGMVISGFIAHFFTEGSAGDSFTLSLAKAGWAISYLFLFLFQLFYGAFYAAGRAFRAKPLSRERIIYLPISLKSPSALTRLSHAVLLSPDAIVLDISSDGTFTIALCSEDESGIVEDLKRILQSHGKILARIFE